MCEKAEIVQTPNMNLHRDTLTMVGRQLERSKKLDAFLAKAEDILFSDEVLSTLKNDPIGLMALYSKASYYKNKADASVIQIMEISNKNDLLKRFIASFMSEQSSKHSNQDILNPESKAKVDRLVSNLTRAGLSKVHGK